MDPGRADGIFQLKIRKSAMSTRTESSVRVDHGVASGRVAMGFPDRPSVKLLQLRGAPVHTAKTSQPDEAIQVV